MSSTLLPSSDIDAILAIHCTEDLREEIRRASTLPAPRHACQAQGWDDEHPNRECGATALYEVPPSLYGRSHWLACSEHVTRHEGDVIELATGDTWTVGS
jgi:hypothetical protein